MSLVACCKGIHKGKANLKIEQGQKYTKRVYQNYSCETIYNLIFIFAAIFYYKFVEKVCIINIIT